MVNNTYVIEIVRRNGLGQTSDDFHATVTRRSDDVKLVYINRWRWMLKMRLRRRALDRAFRSYEKRQRKLAETEQFTR
jgi:molybdopterin-biosynthesis enzyme MoeA-like protein